MPLMPGKSKKAFSKNVSTEMHAGKPQKQALAIAYSTQRRGKSPKKMDDGGTVGEAMGNPFDKTPKAAPSPEPYGKTVKIPSKYATGASGNKSAMYAKGGEIRAASSRPDEDDRDEREMSMLDSHETEHSPESNFHDEDMELAGRLDSRRELNMTDDESLSHGGEINFHDASMDNIDDQEKDRSEMMLDAKPRRHMDERRAASGMVDEDSDDSMELDMLHKENQPDSYSRDGIIRYAEGGSVAERIRNSGKIDMRKRQAKMMADGGEVDLQDNNGDEHLNNEDDDSFEAARKNTYYDDRQISPQPMDSNEHDDELSDADSHDMVSSIRRKMKSKLR